MELLQFFVWQRCVYSYFAERCLINTVYFQTLFEQVVQKSLPAQLILFLQRGQSPSGAFILFLQRGVYSFCADGCLIDIVYFQTLF